MLKIRLQGSANDIKWFQKIECITKKSVTVSGMIAEALKLGRIYRR